MELKAKWVDFQKVPVCIIFPEIYPSLPAGFQTAYFKTIMSFLRCISTVYCPLCQRKKGGRRGGGREDEREGECARLIGEEKAFRIWTVSVVWLRCSSLVPHPVGTGTAFVPHSIVGIWELKHSRCSTNLVVSLLDKWNPVLMESSSHCCLASTSSGCGCVGGGGGAAH